MGEAGTRATCTQMCADRETNGFLRAEERLAPSGIGCPRGADRRAPNPSGDGRAQDRGEPSTARFNQRPSGPPRVAGRAARADGSRHSDRAVDRERR
jgi:hypothetical protein